jgi:hypothetical protein
MAKPKVKVEIVPDARDYCMARLAAARVSAQAALDAIDESLMLFVCPGDDKSGKKREGLMEAASEALGEASRGIEAATGEEGWEAMDDEDVKAEEPDVDDEDEDEEDDDAEDDDEDEDE